MSRWTKGAVALITRNFIFGVEDSLVSTVGMVSGVAAAGVDRKTIFLSGMILIVVEALSMGVGSLLAESSAEEFVYRRGRSMRLPIAGGAIMFVSYFAAGFVPLFPYVVLDVPNAFAASVGASLAALLLLGALSARTFGAPMFRSGFRMLVLGGAAIAAGVAVGFLLR